VLDERFKLKNEMKKLSKDSAEYKALDARQWGLKILANSFYGYLLYARSRWYSRKGGEATTAWARQYIHETIEKAEAAGFRVLYADTDSLFLEYGSKGENSVRDFQKSINASLPERMELELEDFYPRGVFVAKKQGDKGAKKKYALINKEGKIKIRGFELVRRDWSRIARHTQREVLEIMLKEGSIDNAVALVRKVIADLKAGKVSLEDCVIYTQLRKKVDSYEVQSPEVAAVINGRKAGLKIPENSVVGYVITREGKSISEKARVVELAENYDADYYINHQVLPAVLKILGALGFDEESIKTKGSQTSLLGSW
jgi:DNA polymerase I